MPNLFSSDNFVTVEPEVLTIGDRWLWNALILGLTTIPLLLRSPTMPDYRVPGQLRSALRLQNQVMITLWKWHQLRP